MWKLQWPCSEKHNSKSQNTKAKLKTQNTATLLSARKVETDYRQGSVLLEEHTVCLFF